MPPFHKLKFANGAMPEVLPTGTNVSLICLKFKASLPLELVKWNVPNMAPVVFGCIVMLTGLAGSKVTVVDAEPLKVMLCPRVLGQTTAVESAVPVPLHEVRDVAGLRVLALAFEEGMSANIFTTEVKLAGKLNSVLKV